MGLGQKFLHVVQGAEPAVDFVRVDHVVAVEIGRTAGIFKEGTEPQGRDPQGLQVIQFGGNPLDIADPVTVGIAKGRHPDVVKVLVLVPVFLGCLQAELRVGDGLFQAGEIQGGIIFGPKSGDKNQ